MKPGTTGTMPRARIGTSVRCDAAVGGGEVRRRLAERAVGVDEVEGVDVLGLGPAASRAAATSRALSRSPAGGEVVGGAGRQLAQVPEACASASSS